MNNDKTQGFFKIIFKDYTFISFCISLIGVIASAIFNIPILALLSGVILFSAFDAFGYYYATTHYQTSPQDGEYFEWMAAYRVIQTGFKILMGYILFTTSMCVVVTFLFMWWFGVCDWLYYILLKQKYLIYKNMFWLKWTAWGIFTKHPTGFQLLVWSIIAIIVGISTMVYLEFII